MLVKSVYIKGEIMPDFHVVSSYVPSGDQPEAIDALASGLEIGRASCRERVYVLV